MKIFPIGAKGPVIRPAPQHREWMDATPNRYAYRCLPLKIANQCGWEILNPVAFTAMWDGGVGRDAIIIVCDDEKGTIVTSHFGSGILTFQVNALIVTKEDTNLYVTGPHNLPKDAVYPLSGVVETDWSPMTFTMNWIFTRPDTCVRFEKDEPVCNFFPISITDIEDTQPVIQKFDNDDRLANEHSAFVRSRSEFNRNLESNKIRHGAWQRHYHSGVTALGTRSNVRHRKSLKLNQLKYE